MKITSNEIAAIFISAFDMDMQKYLKNTIVELRKTSIGDKIAQWATSNPIKFNVIMHLISLAIQRIPDKKLLLKVVKGQLMRLPSEIIEITQIKIEPSYENDTDNSNAAYLMSGLATLKGWEMQNKGKNSNKISLSEYLDESASVVKKLGEGFKEYINDETKQVIKNQMLEEFNSPKNKLEYYERLKKSNPDMSSNEIIQMMNSEESMEAIDLIINTAIMLPDYLVKASEEMDRINLEIINKVKDKDFNQSIEIYKSVFIDRVSEYINKIINNEELDNEAKQYKINKQLEAYGKLVESCEGFTE
jgi:hypothetical protein